MNCLNKKCKINNDEERMITCWLCLGLMHIKCSGIPVLTADNINKYDGLHWRCNNCKKVEVDFYKFFKNRKSIFANIQKDFIELSKRLDEYNKLFDAFPSLDVFKSPQQSSPKRRKSARSTNKTNNNNPPSPKKSPVANDHISDSSKTSIITGHEPSTSTNTPEIITSLNNQVLNYAEAVKNIVPDDSTTAPNLNRKNSEIIPANNATTLSSTVYNESIISHSLNVVPPRKSIFISRFSYETSANDIDCFIKSKLNSNPNISIKKFTYSEPRSITSFKLTVPFDLYEKILNPDFWPLNTYVREYINKNNSRANNVVELPINPKN